MDSEDIGKEGITEEDRKILTFDLVKDRPKMPLVEMGDTYVRRLIDHVAKGHGMGVDEEEMADHIFKHIAEGPELSTGLMLLACIMKGGRALHRYHERTRIAETN